MSAGGGVERCVREGEVGYGGVGGVRNEALGTVSEEERKEEYESEVLKACCKAVYRFCQANDSVPCDLSDMRLEIFYQGGELCEPIFKYIYRLAKKSQSSLSVVISALVHIDRLQNLNPSLKVNSANAHRLFLTALLIASKYMEDVYFSNKYFAHIGGIENTAEMNRMEVVMLEMLNYELTIPQERYNWYARFFLPSTCTEKDVSDLLCGE